MDPLLCVEWLEVLSDEAGLSRHLTVRALRVSSLRQRVPHVPCGAAAAEAPGPSPTRDARPQRAATGKTHPGAQRGTALDQVTLALGRGWWPVRKGSIQRNRGVECDLLELMGRE